MVIRLLHLLIETYTLSVLSLSIQHLYSVTKQEPNSLLFNTALLAPTIRMKQCSEVCPTHQLCVNRGKMYIVIILTKLFNLGIARHGLIGKFTVFPSLFVYPYVGKLLHVFIHKNQVNKINLQ